MTVIEGMEFGLWIALDMHAAPGSQGVTLGITDGFYPNNLDYPVFQDVLLEIWDAISDRYRDESRIAMYEFINEPNSVPGGGPAIRIHSATDHHGARQRRPTLDRGA